MLPSRLLRPVRRRPQCSSVNTDSGRCCCTPYYTIRTAPRAGPYNSLFIVTNTSPDTKVVRIRFRESKNGRPVASINVYLVPNDSWAAGDRSGPEFNGR